MYDCFRYAQQAGNHGLVMTAARHFWNACLPLIGQPIERQLLKEHLKTVLEAIAATSDKKIKMVIYNRITKLLKMLAYLIS